MPSLCPPDQSLQQAGFRRKESPSLGKKAPGAGPLETNVVARAETLSCYLQCHSHCRRCVCRARW